jgi:uncharacterized protein (TIGR03083 family)
MTIASEISVARAATERLHRDLSTLTPIEWELPGACGIWSVAEVAAHLAWGADIYADGIRRGLQGDSEPPAGFVPIPEYGARAARTASQATAYRRERGERLLEAYETSGRALVELFESVGPSDWGRPAFHPSSIRTIRELLQLRIVELSIHGWDMLNRVGREASLPEGSHAVIVDTLPLRQRGIFARREPLAEPLRYLFVLGSPLLRLVHLHIYGDRLEIDPEFDQSGSDVVVTLDPEAYILLFMGRYTWRQALSEDALGVTGRRDLVGDLDDRFPPG